MKAMTQYKSVGNSRAADKFVVRLPDGMRDKVAEVARQSHRSMNSEIVARLEESLHFEASHSMGEQVASDLSLIHI